MNFTTSTARAVLSSQLLLKRAVLIGTLSVWPETRKSRPATWRRAPASSASAAWPSSLSEVLPESKRIALDS
jgi:hypothetical protein